MVGKTTTETDGAENDGSVRFVNLTPHTLNLLSGDGEEEVAEIDPSGTVARVETESVQTGTLNGVPVYETEFGEVENLPAPSPDTVYIVSGKVLSAIDGREDVLSPGELVRDDEGRPVGAKGLTR